MRALQWALLAKVPSSQLHTLAQPMNGNMQKLLRDHLFHMWQKHILVVLKIKIQTHTLFLVIILHSNCMQECKEKGIFP